MHLQSRGHTMAGSLRRSAGDRFLESERIASDLCCVAPANKVLAEFVNPKLGFTTVREIMANPWQYDGELCEHPIEGKAYAARGKFYQKSMTIFSHGHGGQTFRLMHSERQISFGGRRHG